MYFENNTGDEELDHWTKGISDLLKTDLAHSKYLKVLSGDRRNNILSQLNQLDAKSFSFLNLAGLVIGMSCFIIRGLWI